MVSMVQYQAVVLVGAEHLRVEPAQVPGLTAAMSQRQLGSIWLLGQTSGS